MVYGEAIKAAREHLGLTQEQLARELDVSFSTINRWENSHTIPSRLAKKRLMEFYADKNLPDETATFIFESLGKGRSL